MLEPKIDIKPVLRADMIKILEGHLIRARSVLEKFKLPGEMINKKMKISYWHGYEKAVKDLLDIFQYHYNPNIKIQDASKKDRDKYLKGLG